MRIALVSQEYPPETGHGGIASQTLLKANGLTRLGHEVFVISHSVDGRRSESIRKGVRVIRIPGGDDRLSLNTDIARWLTYSESVAAELAALRERSALDLIDLPDWASEGYVHLLNRVEWTNVPTVVQLHGPLIMFAHALGWPELDSDLYLVGSHMERTSMRLADAVFSSSRCSARWCAQHYGIPEEEIPIIHMGIDTEVFRPLAVPKEERPTIVFVGKVSPTKGAEVLIDAAGRLLEGFPDLQLWMIGPVEADYAERLRSRAATAGALGSVRMFGSLDGKDLPLLLSRAHVFAAPSFYEGGPGFAVLEAMACGLPVVVSEGSGTSEAVSDGRDGIHVPPGDPAALADGLKRILSDEGLRTKLSESALRTIREDAETSKCVESLEGFYEDVVRRSARSTSSR